MSFVPQPGQQEGLGSLQNCLVEADPEQRTRQRRIRRRALVISIVTQSAILTALILVPLLGRPEHIALANMIPIPPYYANSGPTHPDNRPAPPIHKNRVNFCANCFSPHSLTRIPTTDDTPPQDIPPGIGPGDGGQTQQAPWAIGIGDNRRQPAPPTEPRPQTARRISMTRLEPAMLIHRVEPIYPTLMKQIHREGRVELRAIIATDGSIESLQAVAGDAGFYQSALDAVRQWRYKPTVLNGQPVEIDTFITVIYTMQR